DINRQESVAEHTWMMSILAILFFSEMNFKVDQLKVMKMIAIHDLAEAIVGDIPSFEISKRQDEKYENELKAMKKIVKALGDSQSAKEIMELWLELEEGKTNEAKFLHSIDKAEVVI